MARHVVIWLFSGLRAQRKHPAPLAAYAATTLMTSHTCNVLARYRSSRFFTHTRFRVTTHFLSVRGRMFFGGKQASNLLNLTGRSCHWGRQSNASKQPQRLAREIVLWNAVFSFKNACRSDEQTREQGLCIQFFNPTR